MRYRADAETLTPELLGQLREQKPAILEFLQKAEAPGQQQPSLRAAPRKGNLPLSFAQERLWFLDQLEPGSAVYNIPIGLRLQGELNVPVLKRSLDEILRRHESLRTRFEVVEGRPVQVIQPVASLEMPLVDLRGLPEPEREAEARRLCMKEAQRPFDLRHDLMQRVTLLRLGEREHVFLLTLHHIASDGWSVGVLLRELATGYEAFVNGKPSPLPDLPIQYADFAVWQRAWLQGEVSEKQLSYWKKQLEGAPGSLQLPMDRPRPATQSYRGALMSWKLPKPLSVALGELSRREGATLFMTLLAAFQTLLHRYTSSDDIPVGSPIAGRNRTEIEPLIGFFVNTLVMRGDLSGNPSFRTLLRRTREVALGAYAHQDLPFERLVEELHPGRDVSHSPLFQVMFVLQNAPWEAAQLAGLEVTPAPIDSGTSKFDLTLFVRERGGALQAVVEYNTDLFDAETIQRMLGHYQTLLEGIVSNPEQRISDLPLLTNAERHQLLVEWNQTQQDYPRNKCVHELFEEQAERTPEAAAVVFEDQRLTYRELNECANQLAHHLRKLGVGAETPVGVCLERSAQYAVCALGILKAGGAYVPLGTDYPLERLQFMVGDCGAPVVLTARVWPKGLELRGITIVDLVAEAALIKSCSKHNPDRVNTAENPAYVIYTSGSTGQPKGATIPHRGVVRLVRGQSYSEFDSHQRFLMLASTSFDASTFELWGALLNGATCAIFPERLPDFETLEKAIRQHGVTCLWLTAGLFNQIIDLRPSVLETIAHVLTGGEALSVPHVKKAMNLLPTLRITNGYGPTECTTFTTTYTIGHGETFPTGSIPIGRPLANARCYLLDAHLQLVPVGVPAELCVGGDGLARGYLNRPELTAEKFVIDPFSQDPKARLYRTGDLCRWLPDGNIEFLGRLDDQVKIRGFRIELGEIESVLAGLPGVREAVVVAREDVPGDKRLVAFLAAKGGEPPKESELRGLLQAKLPEYMVPAAFVTLDRFPLTPNGKVDRKALPRSQGGQARGEGSYVAPRTPLEETLAGIWTEVLGLKQVGISDNFFHLGGHSLLAVRLQARVEKEFGRRLPLAAFFQAPTVGELATLLADPSVPSRGLHVSAPQSSEDRPPLFYLHFLTQAQRLAKHLGPKWPVYAFTAPFDEELRLWHEEHRLAISMEELAARCLPIIRRVQPKGPYRLAGGCFGGVLAFEIAIQLKRLGGEVAFLALIDAFYGPGCKRLSFPRIRRWAYHGARTFSDGFKYPATKWRKGRELAKQRRSQIEAMRAGHHRNRKVETESIGLPQAEFMGQIQKPYKANPYPGSAVLIRGARQPFFGFDPGATNGWEAVIQGGLQVEDLNCGHMDISEEPHVSKVAKWLEKHLSAMEANLADQTRAQDVAGATMQPEYAGAAR